MQLKRLCSIEQKSINQSVAYVICEKREILGNFCIIYKIICLSFSRYILWMFFKMYLLNTGITEPSRRSSVAVEPHPWQVSRGLSWRWDIKYVSLFFAQLAVVLWLKMIADLLDTHNTYTNITYATTRRNPRAITCARNIPCRSM